MSSDNVNMLCEQIGKLSVGELADLKELLKEKWRISDITPVAAAVSAVPSGATEEVEKKKDSYKIIVTSVGENKIAVIKAVRTITDLTLPKARDVISSLPCVVIEGVSPEKAEEYLALLQEAGADAKLE